MMRSRTCAPTLRWLSDAARAQPMLERAVQFVQSFAVRSGETLSVKAVHGPTKFPFLTCAHEEKSRNLLVCL